MTRPIAAVALLAALAGCASQPVDSHFETSVKVVPIGQPTDSAPRQYLMECEITQVIGGERQPIVLPRLIALEGQEATAFVGEAVREGDSGSERTLASGTECTMLVTRQGAIAEVSLSLRTLERGEERFVSKHRLSVPVDEAAAARVDTEDRPPSSR